MSDTPKNKLVEQEKEALAFWQKEGIFEKSLEKNKNSGKEFIFYEGPPTANGKPGIHHLEARAFKDAIPRYKTMRGFQVRRKGGWDTHGLPVELAVEKELGLKSKKEIESYGIAAFNEKCKESVWRYVREWEDFTHRSGYWVDLKDPYITYKPQYIESLWNIVKTVHEKKLLYKDYKVVPWCPRCGTGLSSHELAQGYEDVKDLSVTVKFKVKGEPSTYLLAWTTTPWTLPGNVGLAVGANILYFEYKEVGGSEKYILAKDRVSSFFEVDNKRLYKRVKYQGKEYSYNGEYRGGRLIGKFKQGYDPLYPFLFDNITGAEKEKLGNAYKIYAADFVTTAEGTGIVHTAVMYGQDDFELGNKVDLPKFHLVGEDGTFKKEAGFLAGKFVKDEQTDVAIIKDLAGRGLLFAKEKFGHSYPFCWRCKTPLIYFARDSWYIKMSALRDKLVKENEKIHWEPAHIKEGRFGEWLREVKDWAISRERYWGTPLPVWVCAECRKQKVVGSIADIAGKPRNNYFVMRHGQAESNVADTLSTRVDNPHGLTENGRKQVSETLEQIKKFKIDYIYASPFLRTKQTAEIIQKTLGLPASALAFDIRLGELQVGELEGKTSAEFHAFFKGGDDVERFVKAPKGGETFRQVKKRVGEFLYEKESQKKGKNILIVTHEAAALLLFSAAAGWSEHLTIKKWGEKRLYIKNAELKTLEYSILPHNADYELDLHRPYIDEVKFACDCGGEMARVREVMDVWFDSGAMPFAQDHYPFENWERIDGGLLSKASGYPADFISEAIDQTRGWFYTLHAIGTLMGKGRAYKNVICLGHIMDAEGKKMSKSVGNVVDPFVAMEKFGADALRFWMYSVNQPGDSKNFDERTVDEVVKKVFNLASNVLAFYKLYVPSQVTRYTLHATHVLDKWIMARLRQLTQEVTSGLESYKLFEPTRAIRDFIADMSQWYIRRSRERFKEEGEDKQQALTTTRFVLLELAKLMAPFAPFFAEYLYKGAGGERESVHLEEWPEIKSKIKNQKSNILEEMEEVRRVVSLALEARARANIKVRQPLSLLKIKNAIHNELLELIKDEVNVKKAVIDASLTEPVSLDITLTPELREEGELRELIRTIQDLRKKKGLKPGEPAVLSTSATFASNAVLKKFESEIKKAASLSKIEHGTLPAGDMELK